MTLDQIFEGGLKTGREREFLGYRPILSMNPLKFADQYEWLTWGDVDNKRRYIGSALHSLFSKGEVGGGEHETVGIWSANRPGVSHIDTHTYSRLTSAEWQILDIAMQNYKKVSVSLYDTLGKDAVGKIRTFDFSALSNTIRRPLLQNTCNVTLSTLELALLTPGFLVSIMRTPPWCLRPRNMHPPSSSSPLKSLV